MKFQVNQAKYANETSVAPVNKRKSVCLEDESIEDPLFAAQVSDYYYITVLGAVWIEDKKALLRNFFLEIDSHFIEGIQLNCIR